MDSVEQILVPASESGCVEPIINVPTSPTSLTTVPLDIYAYILSFLPPAALTTLMCTCRSLSADTLPIFTSRTARYPITELYRLRCFHMFLRVGSEAPRVALIRNLHLSTWKLIMVPKSEKNQATTDYASSILLFMLRTILPSLTNLSRLRLDDTRPSDAHRAHYIEHPEEIYDEVLNLLYSLVGRLPQLEEVAIPITSQMGHTDWNDEELDAFDGESDNYSIQSGRSDSTPEEGASDPLQQDGSLSDVEDVEESDEEEDSDEEELGSAASVRIASLTNLRDLRSLTMESARGRFRLPWVLVDLQPLASSATLTELCVMAHSWIMPSEPFVHVRTLKTCMPLPPNTAVDLVTAFPNLINLALFRPNSAAVAALDVEQLRKRSAHRWNAAPSSKRWHSLRTVRAEDNLVFYSLALPQHVSSVYIGERPFQERRIFPLELAETRPTLLQLQMKARSKSVEPSETDDPDLLDVARSGTSICHLILNIVHCTTVGGLEGIIVSVSPQAVFATSRLTGEH